MATGTTIREKIGLDYLLRDDVGVKLLRDARSGLGLPTEATTGVSTIDQTVAMVAAYPLLKALKEMPERSGRLHEIIDRTQLDLDTALQALPLLESLGIIVVKERDRSRSNHLLGIGTGAERIINRI